MAPHVTRRSAVATFAGAAALAGGPLAVSAHARTAPRRRGGGAPIQYRGWTSAGDWRAGEGSGVRVRPGPVPAIEIDEPTGTREYTDPHTGRTRVWETATWTSPRARVAFGADELVASWNATTPPGTWLEVTMRGEYGDGGHTPWYVMGRWASGDGDTDIRRTSVSGQQDGRSEVAVDTFRITDGDADAQLAGYRLRLTLLREEGGSASPSVRRVGAMASAVPDRFTVEPTEPGPASGVELPVPPYSQNVHLGDYPEYDGGGEAWCSPTSSQMVLEYWGRRPTEKDLAWVPRDHPDRSVDHAARFTYDYAYEGCGNWPFNTAYAATYDGMEGLVTRLGSLTELERVIAAGVPVITSQSFEERELDGAGYGTAGHLMVVVGFTEDGDVVANDPASESNDHVRRVYQRRQFENIWLRTRRKKADGTTASGTGGIAYLVKPRNRRWPRGPRLR